MGLGEVGDLSQRDQTQALMAHTTSQYERIDVLANIVGDHRERAITGKALDEAVHRQDLNSARMAQARLRTAGAKVSHV